MKEPSWLGDINVGPEGSEIRSFFEAGDYVYFTADDGIHGLELWRTDGTDEGTFVVRDINVGPEGSEIRSLFEAGDYVYFTADDGIHGNELWRTDGTEDGTTLVADIARGRLTSAPIEFVVIGERIYFSAGASGTREIWVSEGTPETTHVVADSRLPRYLRSVGDQVVFSAFIGDGNWKLAIIDTATDEVETLHEGAGRIRSVEVFGSTVLFTQGDETGSVSLGPDSGTDDRPAGAQRFYGDEGIVYFVTDTGDVFRSNGTDSGTRLIIGPVYISDVEVVGDREFVVSSEGLWVLEQGADEAQLLPLQPTKTRGSYPSIRTQIGDRWLLVAQQSTDFLVAGQSLWSSDGDPNNTVQLAAGTAISIHELGDSAVVVSDGNLFVTDGTVENTREIFESDLEISLFCGYGFSSPQCLVPGDQWSFIAYDASANMTQFWSTDGTKEHTRQILEVVGRIVDRREVGGQWVVSVYDEPSDMSTLWTIDLSAENAREIQEVSGRINQFGPLGEAWYFIVRGLRDSIDTTEFWLTDLTAENTRMLYATPENCVASGRGQACFVGPFAFGDDWQFTVHAEEMTELWVTDGTAEGTTRFFEATNDVSDVWELADRWYFTSSGNLYSTDGTVAGTVLLREGVNGATLFAHSESVFFFDTDGFLWATSGTAETTVMLGSDMSLGATHFTPATTRLYVSAVDEDETKLWASDGTVEGTRLVGSFSGFEVVHVVGDGFFFLADVDSVRTLFRTLDDTAVPVTATERTSVQQAGDVTYIITGPDDCNFGGDGPCVGDLWVTDGTDEGTRLLQDSVVGLRLRSYFSFSEQFLLESAGVTYFETAGDNAGLWKTDGTADGTVLLSSGNEALPVWSSVAAVNGDTYYVARPSGENTALVLWRSNGTPDGTMIVHRFDSVDAESVSVAFRRTVDGETSFLHIQLGDEATLYQITDSERAPVRQIFSGENIGWIQPTDDGGVLFSADDGVHGMEPWFFASEPERLTGDANNDGMVNVADFLLLSRNFGKDADAVWEDGDFNADGRVDVTDFLTLSRNFGAQRPV